MYLLKVRRINSYLNSHDLVHVCLGHHGVGEDDPDRNPELAIVKEDVSAVETTNVVFSPDETPDVSTIAPDTNPELAVVKEDVSAVETTNVVVSPDETPDVSTIAPDTNLELEVDNNVASAVETTNVVANPDDTPVDVSTDANGPVGNHLEVINNNVSQPPILSSDTPDIGVKDAAAATIDVKSANVDDVSFSMHPNNPRVLRARMKGKVIPPSDKEVITVDSLPASSDLLSNHHLFLIIKNKSV